MPPIGHIFFLSGPSGVGKGTLVRSIQRKKKDWIFPPSATTRAPRPGEKHGETYLFMSDEEFDHLIETDALLEYAVVHNGPRYGTLKDKILGPAMQGKIVMREFDVQGFRQARERLPRHMFTSIFIKPAGTQKELRQRILGRAPMSEEELENRMISLKKELKCTPEYDHVILSHHGQLGRLLRDGVRVLTSTGYTGERAAATHLCEEKGYTLLEKNYRCPGGEVDLVLQHGDDIVFCEVKTRRNDAFGTAIESITPAKIEAMMRCAEHYLERKNMAGAHFRLEAVLVENGAIEHLEDLS